jgi:hypothetical protein
MNRVRIYDWIIQVAQNNIKCEHDDGPPGSVKQAMSWPSERLYAAQENLLQLSQFINYRICTCISRMRVQAAPRFLGQEFKNNSNSYVSRTRFYLCERKIFAIAFAELWLSLAAFTVICQWCHGLPTSGNRSCRLLSCKNMPIHR